MSEQHQQQQKTPVYEFTIPTSRCHGTYNWRLPKPTERSSAKDRQRYEDLTRRLGRYRVTFRGGTLKRPAVFRTSDRVVASYVREQIKAGRMPAVETLRVPLRCPFCDFRTPSNLPTDRKAFDDHLFGVHADEVAARQEGEAA